MTRIVVTLFVTVPLLALAVTAGCSQADDGTGVASVNRTTRPSATASLSVLEQGRRHAQCMRDHGVPEADPSIRPDGGVHLGGGYDKHTLDDDLVKQAIEACRRYQVVLSPEDQAAKLASARALAQCMRARGVDGYPDPDPNDLGKSLPDSVRDDPQYDEATQICETRAPSPGATS